MDHRDAEISDIIVVLRAECAPKLDELVTQLKSMGMEVEDIRKDEAVIEGTIGADLVATIKKLPCVEYVRADFTYIADYPAGDPRNLDASPEEPEEEE